MRRAGLAVVSVVAALALGIAADRVWLARTKTETVTAPNLVDIRFAQFMSQHHEQALLLSQIILIGPPSRVHDFAQGIYTQQLMEAGRMRGWLEAWGQPQVPPSPGMDWMLAAGPLDAEQMRYLLDCRASKTGMAGLLDNDTVNTLRQAQGAERDRLFLELMRRHHEGGIPMARFASTHAATRPVKALSIQIELEQSEEIAGIRMLQARNSAETPPDSKY